MLAYLLSPDGRIGRRAYTAPITAFFALALISAFATGSKLSASAVGEILDNPWSAVGRGMDASALSMLPTALAAPLAIIMFSGAVWALFALTIKRLHDLGHSGWWSALLLIPGVALILMIICALAPGSRAVARLQTNPI